MIDYTHISEDLTMSLARAFQNNAASLAQVHKNHQMNVIEVSTYATSVMSSKLPVLSTNPPDWESFEEALVIAKTAALHWTNSVLGSLLAVPQDIQDHGSLINQLLADSRTQATTLDKDPTDQNALKALKEDLESVSSRFALVTTFISGALRARPENRERHSMLCSLRGQTPR